MSEVEDSYKRWQLHVCSTNKWNGSLYNRMPTYQVNGPRLHAGRTLLLLPTPFVTARSRVMSSRAEHG